MTGRLDGKRMMVTGAAGGIGTAILDAALADGASAVVVADVLPDKVHALVEGLQARGARALGLVLDVGDEGSWREGLSRVAEELGGLDVLVNNAGVTNRTGLLQTELSDWERVVRVNQTGVFLGIKHGAPLLMQDGGGAIVNLASFTSYTGYPAAAYAASKWAVRGITQIAADELGSRGVRVNSVSPGFVPTPLTMDAPNLVRSFTEGTPLGRVCRPEDIASAVVYLSCDDSAYVCGQDLVVDGGFMANIMRSVRV